MLALREQCLFAQQCYGNDVDHATHLHQPHEDIIRYTAAVTGIRQRAKEWRLGQLQLDHENRYVSHTLSRDFYWVRDDYCGWNSNQTWHRAVINSRLEERRRVVTAVFCADLDSILKPATDWPKLELKLK